MQYRKKSDCSRGTIESDRGGIVEYEGHLFRVSPLGMASMNIRQQNQQPVPYINATQLAQNILNGTAMMSENPQFKMTSKRLAEEHLGLSAEEEELMQKSAVNDRLNNDCKTNISMAEIIGFNLNTSLDGFQSSMSNLSLKGDVKTLLESSKQSNHHQSKLNKSLAQGFQGRNFSVL